jgi:putative membrane protein
MKKLTMLLAALAVVGLTTGAASAGAAAAPSTKASKFDKTWLTKAVQIDLAEIKGGEVAMKQGQSAEVKKLGEKLARAHAKGGAIDKKLAKTAGATVPKTPGAKMEAVLKEVAAKKGAAFDQAYAAAEVKGHLEAIKGAKLEIERGSSAKVKKLAKADLKMYEMHLKWARAVVSTLGTGGESESGAGGGGGAM